jgi:hypothetical protein
MKFIKTLFDKLLTCDKKVLGRWNINYCDKVKRKVDFSNEDHCGPCGKKIDLKLREETK